MPFSVRLLSTEDSVNQDPSLVGSWLSLALLCLSGPFWLPLCSLLWSRIHYLSILSVANLKFHGARLLFVLPSCYSFMARGRLLDDLRYEHFLFIHSFIYLFILIHLCPGQYSDLLYRNLLFILFIIYSFLFTIIHLYHGHRLFNVWELLIHSSFSSRILVIHFPSDLLNGR